MSEGINRPAEQVADQVAEQPAEAEAARRSIQTPEVKRAHWWHRVSIAALIVVVLVFLICTVALDPSQTALRVLYGALTAAALFFMWATMNVMIHMRG